MRIINRADILIFRGLQNAIIHQKIRVCLVPSKVNIPGSPIYNPWEIFLPRLSVIILSLLTVGFASVLGGLFLMVLGFFAIDKLLKKKLEKQLLTRAEHFLTSNYENCCKLWNFGGVVLVKADDYRIGCIAPEADWKEFVIRNFASFMKEQNLPLPTKEPDHEQAA